MINAMNKYLFAMFLFALSSLAANTAANAQTQFGHTGPGNFAVPYTIVNYQTGYCLAVQGNNTNIGTPLVTWACNGTPSQAFWFGDYTASGILSFATTMVSMLQPCSGCWNVVGVQGGTDYPLAPLVTWTEDPTNDGQAGVFNNQGWQTVYVGGNPQQTAECFVFENAGGPTNGGKAYVMGVAEGSTAEGAQVVVWQPQGGEALAPNQVWCLFPYTGAL